MPLMGVAAAIVLLLLFLVVEVGVVVQVLVLIAVIAGIAKLAIKWGVKLSPYSES